MWKDQSSGQLYPLEQKLLANLGNLKMACYQIESFASVCCTIHLFQEIVVLLVLHLCGYHPTTVLQIAVICVI